MRGGQLFTRTNISNRGALNGKIVAPSSRVMFKIENIGSETVCTYTASSSNKEG